ncbi:MAG: deoxyribose-phosphate aldolase [Winogradskyella sp.]|uniref:DUF6503 family protein n=1 Tax=Winogradskyella sp. TaxID=1883156 RepID=UPI0017D4C3D7|nr:deoxyribose-phosphate aldolase [Winogradskyella sp.]
MKYLSIIITVCFFLSCKNESSTTLLTANEIINKSIEVSGGKRFSNSVIRFNFRKAYYVARRERNNFSLLRMAKVDNDSVFDLLTNEGFQRFIYQKDVKLEDSTVKKYSASVNSVHYFSVLPYGLNDKAVNKTLLGEEYIKGKAYHKIKVTFDEKGGGEDFEDVFVYWIDKQSYKVHYLAYSYNEDDGKGLRFREAYNERYINGLRFVDYNNFKPEVASIELIELGKAFEANKLILLSKIELEGVEVDLINNQNL